MKAQVMAAVSVEGQGSLETCLLPHVSPSWQMAVYPES